MKWRRHYWLWSVLLMTAVFCAACDVIITWMTDVRVYTEIEQVPPMPVALVLGTAKYYKTGQINVFYRERIAAAVELFDKGKVRGILVSGDNAYRNYNEPQQMKEDLVAGGIPAQYITLDYAGFRTLDSIVRAYEVFGQNEVLVVSQRFHVQRALFLAAAYGIEAYGYAARDVPLAWHVKVRLREVLARTAAVMDVLLGRGPKFLGQLEAVNLKPIDSIAHERTIPLSQ